ncbi:CU044_2847 family protein [Streptomyces sp. NPDC127117]|uniref:CU044_2847 family protein n=1 Tax=Streptomyces sp. NPDC127117 TaxID=3345368 RepID=UPI003644073A
MGQQLARVPLEGGGSILVEAAEGAAGPVKAGRVGDAVRDLPATLGSALEPVTDMARTVLRRLRDAGPAEVEVEFGVDLSTEAGVVITKTTANCHLTVRMVWSRDEAGAPADGVSAAGGEPAA